MKHVMRKDEFLYIFSMGKKLRITAIFSNDADANSHMEKNQDDAVIACFEPFVFLANRHDRGTQP